MGRNSIEKKIDKAKARSQIMRSVLSVGNKSTEGRMKVLFRQIGIKNWKTQGKSLPGTPDFIFKDKKIAIFADGCFWHGCKKCYRRPQSSQLYWDAKLIKNRQRDRKNKKELIQLGWKVIRIWEHELKNPLTLKKKLACGGFKLLTQLFDQ